MEAIRINVYKDKVVKEQGDLFGIFFEDLNHAADGGLYGELIRNRSFEFDSVDHETYNGMTGWETVQRGRSIAVAHIESEAPLNLKNKHYVRLEVMTAGAGGGICNSGFGGGIPLEQGKEYAFSCYYRCPESFAGELIIRLEDKSGEKIYAESCLGLQGNQWQQLNHVLIANETDYEARLTVLLQKPGVIDLDHISLFPQETFLNRTNGLRKDIAELLADMKPSFMRFPGGCLTHIGSLNQADRNSIYRWKNTLGPVEERPARRNSWQYHQTLGLGYYEFFQFCEDIGTEPLPVIAAGYDPHFFRMASMDKMQEWCDEALDLIEFANGEVDSRWGSIRAQLGHPEKFNLKYLGIGNEEVGDAFFERYAYMLEAIKRKYPDIQVIGSAGPAAWGSEYDKGWEQAERTPTSFLDEHYYQAPEWFIANAKRYMEYPKRQAKAFLGEYASHKNTWKNALSEAAFMIGIEKAEAIGLACYAPMLCHVDYINWQANMLFYNNHQVYGTPNYYIQKLFMNYQGQALIETTDNLVEREKVVPKLRGKIAIATTNTEVIIEQMTLVEDKNRREIHLEERILLPNTTYEVDNEMLADTYTMTFTFRRKKPNLSRDLEGKDKFEVRFAMRDEANYMKWVIGGFESMTILEGYYKGLPSGLGMYECDLTEDKTYQAVLKVNKNKVTTFIDGVKYCEHTRQSVVPDALYYSAVKDQDKVMIKVVNVEATEKKLCIELDGVNGKKADCYSMKGMELDSVNSFEEPTKVVPLKETINLENNKIHFDIEPHAFYVFIVEQ